MATVISAWAGKRETAAGEGVVTGRTPVCTGVDICVRAHVCVNERNWGAQA